MEQKIILHKHLRKVFIIVILLNTLALIVFTASASYLDYRQGDLDNDKIPNMDDRDMDGDGKLNIYDIDADNDGINNTEDMLKAAKGFIGRPYDQLMGEGGNIGWKMGAIVCIDLINLSYEKAGIYLEKELRVYYYRNPGVFSAKDWDVPENPYFARRVRNFYRFCVKNRLTVKENNIKAGDIVMFGTGHIAIITKVTKNGYKAIEAAGKRVLVLPATQAGLEKRNVKRYGSPVYARLDKLISRKESRQKKNRRKRYKRRKS